MIGLPPQLQNEAFNFIPLQGKSPQFNGKDWQKQIHSYHEAEELLKKGENYGVMGGHGGLLILDADAKVISLAIESQLPPTFTVKTGSDMKHYYFLCPEVAKKIMLDDTIVPSLFQGDEDHYGEGITWGGQAVGPGSIHPDTKKPYTQLNDLAIAHVTKEQVFTALAPFLKKPPKDVLPPSAASPHSKIDDLSIAEIAGVTKSCVIVHPVHGATGTGNLSIDVKKNVWHCFRCETGGGPLSLIAVLNGVIDCADATPGFLRGQKFLNTIEIAEQKYGLQRDTTPPLTRDDFRATPQTSATTKAVAVPSKFFPCMTFNDLMSTEFPAARFVLDPYFETNAVNMMSAPPNTWKSWFIFSLAGAISSGEALYDHFTTEQHAVMIVNEEDSFRSVQDRFKMLDIKDKKLPIYFHVAQGLKIDKQFVENIVKEMAEKKADVLMLDSLRSMHEAEENDSTEMQVILDHLKAIARQNVTVVFTHHHRKKKFGEKEADAESSRGSSAINAAISGHISLDEELREGGKFLIIRHMKSKVAAKIDPVEVKITMSDMTKTMMFEYQGKFKSSEKKVEQAKIAIEAQLKTGGWKTVNDFVEAGIASHNVVRQACSEMSKAGTVMSMLRTDAVKKGIKFDREGKANEKVYAWCEGKDNELDTFVAEAKTVKVDYSDTIDPASVPI